LEQTWLLAAAGAIGTALIRGMKKASMRFEPETLPPMRDDTWTLYGEASHTGFTATEPSPLGWRDSLSDSLSDR